MSILAIFLYNFGGFVSQLLLLTESLPDLLEMVFGDRYAWVQNRTVILVISLGLFSPFAFLRNIAQYAIISFLAWLCVTGMVLLVLGKSVYELIEG